jgi:hypothetical protein
MGTVALIAMLTARQRGDAVALHAQVIGAS